MVYPWRLRDRLLFGSYYCVYCGAEARGRDRRIPNANVHLPACINCTSICQDYEFASFDEKAAWILKRRLAKGYEPDWIVLQEISEKTRKALEDYGIHRKIPRLRRVPRLGDI